VGNQGLAPAGAYPRETRPSDGGVPAGPPQPEPRNTGLAEQQSQAALFFSQIFKIHPFMLRALPTPR